MSGSPYHFGDTLKALKSEVERIKKAQAESDTKIHKLEGKVFDLSASNDRLRQEIDGMAKSKSRPAPALPTRVSGKALSSSIADALRKLPSTKVEVKEETISSNFSGIRKRLGIQPGVDRVKDYSIDEAGQIKNEILSNPNWYLPSFNKKEKEDDSK